MQARDDHAARLAIGQAIAFGIADLNECSVLIDVLVVFVLALPRHQTDLVRAVVVEYGSAPSLLQSSAPRAVAVGTQVGKEVLRRQVVQIETQLLGELRERDEVITRTRPKG